MPDHRASISRCCDKRPWALVDTRSRIGYCSNASTARALTSRGFPIRVSFELADPPGVSLCFVHCPGRNKSHFDGDPLVLSTAQSLVLLVVSFSGSPRHKAFEDYFVYRAGPGTPRLHLIPGPYPRSFAHNAIGMLPLCDGVSDHYALVAPVRRYNHATHSVKYDLNVFWSHSKVWTTKETLMARDLETNNHKVLNHKGTGVISVGGGVLGWVDLWWGILLCNVLDDNPQMRLVQWPVPEPCSELLEFKLELDHISPRPFRDVTVTNGLIKFVELKVQKPTVNQRVINQGWTVTTWNRIISSVEWHEGSTVHMDDISIIDSVLLGQMPFLLPELLGEESKRLTWDQVNCTSPTLCLTDDDVVYIMLKTKLEHPIAFVLAVNIKNRTLEALEHCYAEKMTYLEPTYIASAFSSYLGIAAGSTPTVVLERPYTVDISNIENDVTVEQPPLLPKERPKKAPAAVSSSLPPAQKDVTKKNYASIVKEKELQLAKPVYTTSTALTPWLTRMAVTPVA